jgi:hypothetical protein
MPYTADDCSELCWPPGKLLDEVPPEDHARCEQQLMDFSNPEKQSAYCACDCHYVPGLPGFSETVAGRYVTREDLLPAGR